MPFQRSSGILLHPTALPGDHGIGALGEAAERFIDFLADAKQQLWQVCPLGPTGFGNSPYQCFSAFAGNPLLIDLDQLRRDGLLGSNDLVLGQAFPADHVDYPRVIAWKMPLLERAFAEFRTSAPSDERDALAAFCQQQAFWLDDFSLFMAIKERYGGRAWSDWDDALRLRDPSAIRRAAVDLADRAAFHRFTQYLFFRQWAAVKAYGNERGIKVIGDIPIFVALDSADVWALPELFLLDTDRRPTAVAGVPPDYFSATGQLWGNPLYDWERHAQTGYRWWIDVIRAKLSLCDILRIDHFRGFAGYWAVPAGDATALNGSWQPGPGHRFFAAVRDALGPLPVLAEDLGVITPDVDQLRDAFGFPGMKILQFAFDSDEEHEFRPHTYSQHCVVYTGTHDNDTIRGWHAKAKAEDRAYAEEYLHSDGTDLPWDFIRVAWGSTALMALAPLQDVLGLGSEARFNTPGTIGGNWEWRVRAGQLTADLAARLRRVTQVYVR